MNNGVEEEGVSSAEKDKGGRPPHKPSKMNRKFVKTMLGAGLKQSQVCAMLEISEPTFRKHYNREIETAEAEVHALVGQSLVFNAIGGPEKDWTKANMSAAIFYAKTRMGWKEASQDFGVMTIKVIGGLPETPPADESPADESPADESGS
jgi:hypothetical protein